MVHNVHGCSALLLATLLGGEWQGSWTSYLKCSFQWPVIVDLIHDVHAKGVADLHVRASYDRQQQHTARVLFPLKATPTAACLNQRKVVAAK